MIKRIFSFVLAVLLVLGMLPQLGVQAGAVEHVLDAEQIDGRSFSTVYGEKLNQVLRGEAVLFSDSDDRLPLGISMDTGTSYRVAGIISGYQCYIYAQAVYYYLFGDVVYHGSGYKYWSNSKRVLSNQKTASYELFSKAGVGFGAYIRTTTSKSGAYNGEKGHSLIVLDYDELGVTFLEGNADGKGLVRITVQNWEEFNEFNLTGRGRRIAHVVQCIPAACGHTSYSALGNCQECGAEYDFAQTYSKDAFGYYFITSEEDCKVAQLPYSDAAELSCATPGEHVEVLGSVTNAFGETWYQVCYDDQTGYIAAQDLHRDPVTPGKPTLRIATEYKDTAPTVFSWGDTPNTTHYDLYLYAKDAQEQWQTYEWLTDVSGGVSMELPEGEYRVELRAYNADALREDETDFLYTPAETAYLTIKHIHAYQCVVTTQPTCTVAGEEEMVCTDCGTTDTKTIPALGHTYVDMFCEDCGAKEQPACTLQLTRKSGKPVLSWDKAAGAKKYEVYRATSADGKYTKLTTTTKRSYTDSKASASTQYFYKIRVRSADAACDGKYSNVVSTCARPVLQATLTEDGKPVITWKPVEGAVQYKLSRSTKSGSGYKVIATVEETEFTDASAVSGKTYYYKAVAVGVDSESASSSYKKVAAKCIAPDLSLQTAASGKPALSWNKIAGAKKYEIYRSVNGGKFKKLTTTTKLYYTDTKATAGTVCAYKVRALGSGSSYTGPYSVVLNCDVVCTAPSLTVKVDSATGKPSLSWKKVTGAVSYEIYRSEAGGEYALIAAQTGRSFIDTDAQAGMLYSYKVRALGKTDVFHSGESTSKSVTATCGQPKPKGKISSAGKPVLVWGEVDGADNYAIYRSTSKSKGYKMIDQTDDLTYTDTSAKKNKTYYYKIVALTEDTQSVRSGYVKLKARK